MSHTITLPELVVVHLNAGCSQGVLPLLLCELRN